MQVFLDQFLFCLPFFRQLVSWVAMVRVASQQVKYDTPENGCEGGFGLGKTFFFFARSGKSQETLCHVREILNCT